MLDQRLADKAFDRLVIVAPPVALGDLRAGAVRAREAALYAELGKDLTKTPAAELPEHLAAVLAV